MLWGAVAIVIVNLIKLLSFYGRLLQPMIRFVSLIAQRHAAKCVLCSVSKKSRQSRDSQALPRCARSKSEINLKCFQRFLLGQKCAYCRSNKQSPQKAVVSFRLERRSMACEAVGCQYFYFLRRKRCSASTKFLPGVTCMETCKLEKRTKNTTRRSRHDFLAFLRVKPWVVAGKRLHDLSFLFAIWLSSLQLFSAKNMLVMNRLLEIHKLLEY